MNNQATNPLDEMESHYSNLFQEVHGRINPEFPVPYYDDLEKGRGNRMIDNTGASGGNWVDPSVTKPLVQINLYHDTVLVTEWALGKVRSRPVSIESIASIFSNMPIGTGVLPPNTLFWLPRSENNCCIGLYFEPQQYSLIVDHAPRPDKIYNLKLPGLVFVGNRKSYYLFAVKERPSDKYCDLYYPPLPNIYADGQICQGDLNLPPPTKKNIRSSFDLIFKARFTNHLAQFRCVSHPTNIYALWEKIERADDFPYNELVPVNVSLPEVWK